MNRHECRKARKATRMIGAGAMPLPRDAPPLDGLNCYVCEKQVCAFSCEGELAIGVAVVMDDEGTVVIPLCENCLRDPSMPNPIARKYFGNPSLEIGDEDKISAEVFRAYAESFTATEH